jgi:hypothetical protein
MISAKYVLMGAGAAVAMYYGGSYLVKLNRLSNELETQTKVSIHKVSLSGIELKIQVQLKNPSGGSVKLKHPFVKLMYAGKTVASSQAKDVNITIPKFSEVNLNPITITLGFLSLATTAPALFRTYRDTGKIDVEVETITTINDTIPYKKVDKITLGGGKPA